MTGSWETEDPILKYRFGFGSEMFYKAEIPFVRLLLPLIAGISAACLFEDEVVYDSVKILILPALILFAALIMGYRRLSLYRYPWMGGGWACLFITSLGYIITADQSLAFAEHRFDKFRDADVLMVRISDEPRQSNNILRFESVVTHCLSRDKWKLSTGKLMISINLDTPAEAQFSYGDLLLVPALYDPVNPPYNPGEFDYRSYLAWRQIHFQAFFNREEIQPMNENRGNRIISFALDLRKKMVDKFTLYLPDSDAAAFASTLILGYRAELSRELVEAYSDTGTMHVLSVSGMHVGIIFLVLSFLLRSMDRRQSLRLFRATLTILIIWFYAMITGFSAPASRAAFMLSFVVLGKALLKHQNTYNLIAISAFFLLLYNPFYLVDAGFQLSYLAVLGLVYFQPLLRMIFPRGNKITDPVWNYCALSMGAQLTTFPVSIYYFHQFPMYFLLSNLFIVFPAAIIMYAGIGFMFITSDSVLYYLGMALNRIIMETNRILFAIGEIPYSTWEGLWISLPECFILYLLMACLILRRSFDYRRIWLPLTVLSILFSVSRTFTKYQDARRKEIIFYNLRKNTAMAYIDRGESTVVSDLRREDRTSGYSILPALQSRGSATETFFSPLEEFTGRSRFGMPNFYQFAGYKILRWDAGLDSLVFKGKLSVDALWLGGGSRISLSEIQRSVSFEKLVIDADNPEFRIRAWQSDALKLSVSCYVLKNNQALVIKL